MTQPAGSGSWRDHVPALALILSVAGLLWGAAQAFGQLDDHNRRIVMLEAESKADKELARANAERLARIEANLEYIVRERRL